tara:strand:+ start:215 stop:679 length:465 start_codon:yes stop_codon:yes gene_type:complete
MRRTASSVLRDLEIRVANLEKSAGRIREESDTLTLPNGSKLTITFFPDGNNSRFAFELDGASYFAYDSRRNFGDMLSDLEDMNIRVDRSQGSEGKAAVIKFWDGSKLSMTWLATGRRGEIRLGFGARGASYFAYDSRRNYNDMISDLEDAGFGE